MQPMRCGRFTMNIRPVFRCLVLAAWILVCSGALTYAAQAAVLYPDKPIHLIVPYPAGGGADHWGRLVAEKLAARLGQPIVVENISGKGGNNGTAVAAKAAADGDTLLLGSVGPLAVHQFTYASLPFSPQYDFVPIASSSPHPSCSSHHRPFRG